MNEQLRNFEKKSGLEIYGLGAKREQWEATIEKFAELVINDVIIQSEEANTKHCCATTYDLGVANCAQEKIVAHLKKHYNIKTVYGVYK
jgi:hypothetical protein